MATKHVILSSSSTESSYDSRAEDHQPPEPSKPKKLKKKSYKCKYRESRAAKYPIGLANQINTHSIASHTRKTFLVIIKTELML